MLKFIHPSIRSVTLLVLAVMGTWGLAVYLGALPLPHHPLSHSASKLYRQTSIAVALAPVATAHHNLAYCHSPNPQQQLDLYTPKAARAPYPLVVFIHGGGWFSGSKADPIMATYGPQLLRQGFALASINYRLDPRYTYPVQDQDVGCALSYLYNNAATYRLDNQQIGLFGASAGGQLAVYAAISTASRTQPWYGSIRGVVDFYGVADLTAPRPGTHLRPVVGRFVGSHHSHADDVAASPVTYADLPAPPVLIFHGDRDPRVPLAQSQELARDLTASGNSATLVVVHHAGHGFGLGDQPSVPQIRTQLSNFFTKVLTSAA